VSITALKAARPLLRAWRAALFDSHVNVDSGKVEDEQMAAELARFDRAINLIDRATARHRLARKQQRMKL
jgi:hypothetical protein